MGLYSFPAKYEPNGCGGFIVSFRDIPEALTEVSGKEEIKEYATDALITAMDFYFEDQRQIPSPSKMRDGEVLVELPASVVAKILLLNSMIQSDMKQSDIAKKIGVTRQEMSRIVDLHHSTKIDTIQKAIYATGKSLVLAVS